MKSSFGLTKGLAVDISAPLKYKAEMDFRENVRAQKEQEAQQKRLADMQDKLRVVSQKIGVPQFQQQAKDVSSQYFAEVMDNYKINKRYLNSVEFAQKSNETLAKLMNISGQDEALRKDLEFQRNKADDFGFKGNLDQILLKGTQADFNNWMSSNNGYTPGKGLVQKHNQEDFLNSIIKYAPIKSVETYTGTQNGMDLFRTDRVRDIEAATPMIKEYMNTHPATLEYFGGDVSKAAATVPKLIEMTNEIKYKPTANSYKTDFENRKKYRFSNLGTKEAPVLGDNNTFKKMSMDNGQKYPFVQIGTIDPNTSSTTKPIRFSISRRNTSKGYVYNLYDMTTGEVATTNAKKRTTKKDGKETETLLPSKIIGSDSVAQGGIRPEETSYRLEGFGYLDIIDPQTNKKQKTLVASVTTPDMPNKRYAIPLTPENAAIVTTEIAYPVKEILKAFETNDFSNLPEVYLESFQK